MAGFPPALVDRLARTEEIDVETQGGERELPRRTTIWVVVVNGDVFIRSFRGPRGLWYQAMRAIPLGAVHVESERVPVRAEPVTDPETLGRVSDAYLEKYRESPYAFDMVRPETVPTTLRLVPAREWGKERG